MSGAISCTQAYLSQYGSLWGVPVALGGVVYFATVLLIAGVAGQSRSGAVRTFPRTFRAVDRCARVRAVSRLGVSLQAEHGLPALRDHVCRGHCALHHLGWCDYISHDFIASARVHGCGKTRQEPARARLGGGLALGTLALLNGFPREAHARRLRRRRPPRLCPPRRPRRPRQAPRSPISRRPSSSSRTGAAAVSRPHRCGRQGPGRQVQRLSVPAVRQSFLRLQAAHCEVRQVPGRSSSCSSTSRSSASATPPSPAICTRVVRGGGGGRHGADEGNGR